MNAHTVLVIDDEENFAHMLQAILRRHGYQVSTTTSASSALDELGKRQYDLILCDVNMPQMGGLQFLESFKEGGFDSTVIMMSAYGSIDTAIEAMKLGAYDYISKPFKSDEILLTLRKAEEREKLQRENRKLREQISREYNFGRIVTKSSAMLKIFRTIEKISEYKTTVLVTGESGTGKELIARALHLNSDRRDRAFVAVNCGAIPENLLESELFGHVKGAFTDAIQNKPGLFEEAHGGTLFLDEIGELPSSLQVKLLRVLQEEGIRRVGDTRDVKVDVRIIAATIRDLGVEVREKRFREVLFYRLNVLPIHLPPLRERKEDIPLLIDHFIRETNRRLKTVVDGITSDALKVLLAYAWPGNVRELENLVERAIVLTETDRITLDTLPEKLFDAHDPVNTVLRSGELSIKKTSRIIEEQLIRRALKKTSGNRTYAARLLEISHRALLYKIREYGIDL
ncbi:MAG: sigma-54-dependent Fis family transcriptional regulator [Myxococcales bacterium]|nr:sigma-54-dependent Fis family transcriptional regulator [Myxococcales bacterium]